QRRTVAKLDYVVERAERILAGDTDSSVTQVIPIELPDAASAEPMRLPDPVQVRHPVLDPPSGSPTERNTTQLFVVRDDEPTRTNDDRGEVA
ncbi:MAG TPA: hypothetical protein VMU34_02765, partial [Mycobacterium sp.]|nr:hypothetical protein [Mycobacterium sp.]